MNAEQIEKLIEVLEVGRDAAHEVAQRFHDEMKGYREAEHKQVDKDVADLNEAIAMLEAERATQPAMSTTFDRRWSLARDGFGFERNDNSGEYVAYDDAVSVLHSAIPAPQPAQDQVAAVRAVPEDEKWSRIADRLNELDKAIAYSTNLTASSKPRRLLYSILNEVCGEPAPSPQPELSGSIDTPKFITTAKVGKAVITPRGMEVIGEDMVSFSPAPQPAESVDTPEFRKLVDTHNDEASSYQAEYRDNKQFQEWRDLVAHINTWSNARCAMAREEATGVLAIAFEKMLCAALGRDWAPTGLSASSLVDALRQSATAAETRLAEIQRGVEELPNIWSELQASQLHATYEVCRKTVLRLFNPPSQSDTSGLSG